MNRMHEANRQLWNDQVAAWEERSRREGKWQHCHRNPELAFEGEALELIREFAGSLESSRVCIIGSGDQMAAFALAGLGAQVTSTDISEERLALGARKAEQLDLSIDFVRADAANLESLADSSFDLVCSTNGFFVWISDLAAVFAEAARILVPGGLYVYVDIHPFQRPWQDRVGDIEVEKSYWNTGPFKQSDSESYEFNWTLADLLNPMAAAGLMLAKLLESPAADTRYWTGSSDDPSSEDQASLDWHVNPLAALPVWLSVAARKSA